MGAIDTMQVLGSVRTTDASMTLLFACSLSKASTSASIFTGKERDTESGNDYFGARYYASTMGRFLSPDWSDGSDPDPENGAIRRGDLLVSSSKAGYAMKGTDRERMLGAVIGKTMGSLHSGSGVIEVLVTLQ